VFSLLNLSKPSSSSFISLILDSRAFALASRFLSKFLISYLIILQVFSTKNISFFYSINSTIPSFFLGAKPFLVLRVSLFFYLCLTISYASLISSLSLLLNLFRCSFLISSLSSSSSIKFLNYLFGFLQEEVFLSHILKFLFYLFIYYFFYFSDSLKINTSSSLGNLNGLTTSFMPAFFEFLL